MKTPVPGSVVQSFGDWAINLKVSFWVSDLTEGGTIRSNAMIEIIEMLAASGIHLPVVKGPETNTLIQKALTPRKTPADN